MTKTRKITNKIAVFHNFLDNIGGAEIVALTLASRLDADLYTTNIDAEKIEKMGFGDVLPKIYSIGRIPVNAPFRQQMAFYKFRKLNLKNKYDFYIIAGDWAMSGAVNNKPNLWYVHSPLNELWAFRDYIKNNIVKPWQRPIFDAWVLFNRYLNKKYLKSVDNIVCNSINTKNRTKKYYGRESKVINPPIETSKYKYENPKNYWLSVNRLAKAKRIDIQLRAFENLPKENLIIVGSYEKGARQFEKEKSEIERIIPKNVTVKNWVPQDELIKLYANCKGFITTSMNEDFGMNVIEAMASGKPVIAPDEGGYRETITPETGILIKGIDENKLAVAIEEINKEIKINSQKYKNACMHQAKNFDTRIFIEKIKSALIKNENSIFT